MLLSRLSTCGSISVKLSLVIFFASCIRPRSATNHYRRGTFLRVYFIETSTIEFALANYTPREVLPIKIGVAGDWLRYGVNHNATSTASFVGGIDSRLAD